MSKSQQQARAVIEKARELGFTIEVLPNVVRVHRTFQPGDAEFCVLADGDITDPS